MMDGIDVSSWQGEIDWARVARAGKTFAWMRASFGVTPDERFAANWSGALYLGGMQRGAYHFFMATSSAASQADAFLRVYPGAGELPPVLDLERGLDGSAPRVDEALTWIEIVRRELGVQPIIYVSPSFADEHRFHEHPELAASGVWSAHWDPPHGPPLASPRVPRPWSSWRAWQRGTGRVAGIKGLVDLDVMQG